MKKFEIVTDLDLTVIHKPGETAPPHIWCTWLDSQNRRCKQMMDFSEFIDRVCGDGFPNVDPPLLAEAIVNHLRKWHEIASSESERPQDRF